MVHMLQEQPWLDRIAAIAVERHLATIDFNRLLVAKRLKS